MMIHKPRLQVEKNLKLHATGIPTIQKRPCLPSPPAAQESHNRPQLLIAMVIKVMARLFFAHSPAAMVRSHSQREQPDHITIPDRVNQVYLELVALRDLMASVTQKSAAKHTKTLSIVVIHALRLACRLFEEGHVPGRTPAQTFLGCLMLAETAVMDTQTSTKTWAAVAGMSDRREVALLKDGTLRQLQYHVHIESGEFARWCQSLMQEMRRTNGDL